MARVLVGVKRVIDYDLPVEVRPDKLGVETEGVHHIMNPFDEIAMEEAVQMKERFLVSNITAVCCGPPKGPEDILRTALAMGADKAIHIEVPEQQYEHIQPIHVSKMLAKVALKETVDMVFLGKQAIDDDCNQTAQMTAGYLDWPQATFASKMEKVNGEVNVTREIDGGVQEIKVRTPMVMSADLRLNEPRYITLPSVMKARKQNIFKMTPEELGVDLSPRTEVLAVEEPPAKEPGPVLPDVDSLIARLRQDKFIP